jgi:site-specific DNA-methyltransferase (adenine-specific)
MTRRRVTTNRRADVPRNVVLIGDALERLRGLPAASVDCVITSPPYYALRNYQAEGQIGLEASVDGWVSHLVAVADELARVLKPQGVLWLNVGDSYSRHHKYGAPPKSFLLGPERLLLALSRRGWIVRNKVVWSKQNPMPASVRDRLTASWEPVYLLVRSRRYYFDLNAIRVPHRSQRKPSPGTTVPRERAAWAGPLAGDQSGLALLKARGIAGHPLGKNPGDVWTVQTSSFRGGHHATFPEALVAKPLLATCPERACVTCGLAWRRERVARTVGHLAVLGELRPACSCDVRWRPGVVLDPFIGSGTTAVVAERLGRDWLGIELRPEFARVAEERVRVARAARAGPDRQAA